MGDEEKESSWLVLSWFRVKRRLLLLLLLLFFFFFSFPSLRLDFSFF